MLRVSLCVSVGQRVEGKGQSDLQLTKIKKHALTESLIDGLGGFVCVRV